MYNPFQKIFPNGVRQDNVLVDAAHMLNPFAFLKAEGKALNAVFGNPGPAPGPMQGPQPAPLAYGPNNGRYAINDPSAMYGAPAGERNMPDPTMFQAPPMQQGFPQDGGLDAVAGAVPAPIDYTQFHLDPSQGAPVADPSQGFQPISLSGNAAQSNPFSAPTPQQSPQQLLGQNQQPMNQATAQAIAAGQPIEPFSNLHGTQYTPTNEGGIQGYRVDPASNVGDDSGRTHSPNAIPLAMYGAPIPDSQSAPPQAPQMQQIDMATSSPASQPMQQPAQPDVNSEAYAQQLLNAPTGQIPTSGPAPGMMAYPLQGQVQPSSAQQFQLNPDSQATYDMAQKLAQQQLQQAMGSGQSGYVQQAMQDSQGRMRRNNMMSSLAGAVGAFMPQGGMGRRGAGSFANGAIGSFQTNMQRRNNNETQMYNALSRQMGDGQDLGKMAQYLNAVRGYDPSSPENQRKATYSDARQQDAGSNAQNANTKEFVAQDMANGRAQRLQLDQFKAQNTNDIGRLNAATAAQRANSYSDYLSTLPAYHQGQLDQREAASVRSTAVQVARLEEMAAYHKRMGDTQQFNALMDMAHDMAIEKGAEIERINYAANPKNKIPDYVQQYVGVPQAPPQPQQQNNGFFGLWPGTPQPAPQAPATPQQPQPSQSDLIRQQAMGMMGGQQPQPQQPQMNLQALLAERERRRRLKGH